MEEGSCSNIDTRHDRFEIMHRKNPKLNLVNEQEEIVETVKTLRIMDTGTGVRESKTPIVSEETHQPSTSDTHNI